MKEFLRSNWWMLVVLTCGYITASMLTGCNTPKYIDDIGFTVSATANSPEFPVAIDGTLCRDMHGVPGFCAVRQDAGRDFIIDVYEQQYDYELTFNCSSNVAGLYPIGFLVLKNTPFKLVVPRTTFPIEKVFSCSVIVNPKERPEPIASFARVSVTVVDAGYQKLEQPYLSKNHLVLGEHALYGYYKDSEGWHMVRGETVLKDKYGITEVYVESYAGRHAYGKFTVVANQSQEQQ